MPAWAAEPRQRCRQPGRQLSPGPCSGWWQGLGGLAPCNHTTAVCCLRWAGASTCWGASQVPDPLTRWGSVSSVPGSVCRIVPVPFPLI